jgi:hypothetical protein
VQYNVLDIHVSTIHNYRAPTTNTNISPRNVGAVAELIDISCLYGTPEFESISIDAFKAWSNAPSSLTAQKVITILGSEPVVLGQHYFVPGTPAPSPKWDFTSDAEKGNSEAFVVAAGTGSIPSPESKNDITWVQLKKVQGELADSVYRVETAGGLPPASVSRVKRELDIVTHCY